MEADINNGGFMQFLCNWGDPTCQLALRALQAMGAVQTHAILAGMRGLLDRLEDDPAITQLHDLYGAMTEQEQDALHAFDEAAKPSVGSALQISAARVEPSPCSAAFRSPRVRQQHHQIFFPHLLQRMRAARARQQRMARAHVVLLSIQHVAALPADDVVDLILVLRVQADAGALVQHPLAQHERQIRRASEERIRGGRP
ncbi:hypothetical protein G6F63_013629 [Rhizopus arrhizus]|nr:hypothetical protein G6F63_013629 [Rhizopus arrhizus]